MSTCSSCANEIEVDAAYCGHCGARVRARKNTLVGTELDGRFRVDSKIAEGGFGAIYRGTHLASKHVVALKVLHAELALDESLAARFRREGETLSMLRSPHTVSVYEVGETEDGTLYIAMELLRGESLLDRYRARGPLPWRSVLEIMKQVCRSLGEAHALGIIHRDLKPGNIHLEANDHVKVIDFGIAKLMRGSDIDDGADLTRVGQAVGTLEYMSPEQLIGGACDGRSDIYALGVLVYEMLTGRRPYNDATGPTSLVAAVMTQPLIPPSRLWATGGITAEVNGLVLECLAKDPKDRFANVGAVVAAIDEIIKPLARGSWTTEVDEESTWIDDKLPAPPSLPNVIIAPQSQPRAAMHAGGEAASAAVAFARTHEQAAMTEPDLIPASPPGPVTPSRGLARGSASPVNSFGRARRESDRDVPTPVAGVFADGSRVRPRPMPNPDEAAPTGSEPLVDFAKDDTIPGEPPKPERPVTDKTRAVKPLSWGRVVGWTVALLAGGAAVGMAIASLIS